jgi:hypothetical protein
LQPFENDSYTWPRVTGGFLKDSKTQAQSTLSGESLLEEVVALTGVPQDQMKQELSRILSETGHGTPEELTIETLRASLLAYLEELDNEAIRNNPALN